ncbi:uncharacterized protein DUF4307 [Kineococcus xinjiangensis]|uniref:Uncharacterized protein DUF4307 n=1 Tax=Kineococcus xinjiangensis TaxID=512762 RepID=A0A2S6IXD0_9ACTN|nr:DUF4307 domain-containing protein [Kineococcus xinjiangensis]PPK98890.1 uncharacterized protein DUF4307 [Kineococcus xinjiangensis]
MPTPPSPSPAASGGDRLAERYGRVPSPGRRRALRAAAVLGGLLAVAYLVWVALASTAERAEPTVISYRVLGDSGVELRYTLAKDPGSTVHCVLQALDARHAEVGVVEDVTGPGTEDLVDHTTLIRTTGRPVTAVVRTCSVVP